MKKFVILLFIVFVMLHIAWGKSGNETKLEKVRFSFLTADSLSCTLIYNFFENKELANKQGLIILSNIQTCLEVMKYLLLSSETDNDSKESSICCNIRSNNNILVKLITSSPSLAKNRILLRTLIFLLHLPISAQDKELVQKFMKEHYSVEQISVERKTIMTTYNIMGKSFSKNFEESFFITSSYLREYTKLLHIFSLFQNGKIFEIKCFLRNQIVYNHILISLILQRNPVYAKEKDYVDYQKNLIIQKILSDYESKKRKGAGENRHEHKDQKQ